MRMQSGNSDCKPQKLHLIAWPCVCCRNSELNLAGDAILGEEGEKQSIFQLELGGRGLGPCLACLNVRAGLCASTSKSKT